MSDDLDKTIKQALDMLSKPENLKGILDLLGNSMGSQGSSQSQSDTSSKRNDASPPIGDLGNSVELLRKAQEVMGALNSRKDPRVNLLTAVTPFLNSRRQRAVSDCVQFLRISQVLPILLNNGNSKTK